MVRTLVLTGRCVCNRVKLVCGFSIIKESLVNLRNDVIQMVARIKVPKVRVLSFQHSCQVVSHLGLSLASEQSIFSTLQTGGKRKRSVRRRQ